MATVDNFIVTLDVDWAHDFMINQVADMLIRSKVKATWFITHKSPAVERLSECNDLFEIGIHPNMLPSSTHGTDADEVLRHVRAIAPHATAMRTHGLYQTSNWLKKASKEFGIKIDVSLFLPRATHLSPHKLNWENSFIWRIPYFWEDDAELFEADPIWSLSDSRLQTEGLKVFNFHPVHIALNTAHHNVYAQLKNSRLFQSWDEKFIKPFIHKGSGPRTFFIELIDALKGKGKKISSLIDEMENA